MIVIPTVTGIVQFATEQERLYQRVCLALSLNSFTYQLAPLAVALVIARPAVESEKSKLVAKPDGFASVCRIFFALFGVGAFARCALTDG